MIGSCNGDPITIMRQHSYSLCRYRTVYLYIQWDG